MVSTVGVASSGGVASGGGVSRGRDMDRVRRMSDLFTPRPFKRADGSTDGRSVALPTAPPCVGAVTLMGVDSEGGRQRAMGAESGGGRRRRGGGRRYQTISGSQPAALTATVLTARMTATQPAAQTAAGDLISSTVSGSRASRTAARIGALLTRHFRR